MAQGELSKTPVLATDADIAVAKLRYLENAARELKRTRMSLAQCVSRIAFLERKQKAEEARWPKE